MTGTSPRTRALASALPGLSLAAASLLHPHHLTAATADRWWLLHVAGLFVFPLVGVTLMALVRGRRDPVARLVVVLSFVYATAYTALDVISGIGAGFVTSRLAPGAARPDEVRSLFAIGTPIGEVGSWALVLAAVVLLGDAVVRDRATVAPGVLIVAGAVLVHVDHIFAPWGGLGMALIGAGTGLTVLARLRSSAGTTSAAPIRCS